MPNVPISGLTSLSVSPATIDVLPIVDVSDTSQAPTGTTKKLLITTLFSSPALSLPTVTGQITLTGGTVTVSTPVIDATQTWNAGGVTFTGIKLNVTNTASAAASKLLDLQVAAASIFSVGKAGDLAIPALARVYLDGGTNTYLVESAADEVTIVCGASNAARFDNTAAASTDTRWLVSVGGGVGLQRVTIGANDSGGAGFRYLRVPN